MKHAAGVLGILGILVSTSTIARAESERPRASKNPRVATALAVVGTLVGPALITAAIASDGPASDPLVVAGLASLVVGPSLGHVYTHSYGRAGIGAGARALGGAALVLSVFTLGAAGTPCATEGCSHDSSGADLAGAGLLLVGLAGVIGGTVYDIADAGTSARHYNAVHFDATPIVIGTSSSTTLGFGVSGSF